MAGRLSRARMTAMASTEQPTIVAGTDGSKTAERAVREAAGLARATGARLVLVSAFSDLHPYRERIETSARETLIDLEKVSDQLLQRARSLIDDGSDVETVSREGDPAEVLADVAQELGARTIVVGDRGLTAVKRFLLGSVSNKLAHHAPCDILIVRGSADD
jgi:nucleotide-binding universal stress UspA family protein